VLVVSVLAASALAESVMRQSSPVRARQARTRVGARRRAYPRPGRYRARGRRLSPAPAGAGDKMSEVGRSLTAADFVGREAFFMPLSQRSRAETPDPMPELSVRLAASTDRPVLERLWLLFRHDMSEFNGALPGQDGSFRSERLTAALADPDWAAYLLSWQDRPAGLGIVRNLAGPVRVLNSFFVVRGARRAGLGLRAAQAIVAEHPGAWEVAFQDANPGAAGFWRRVAADVSGQAWMQEHRPVPGRPDLPPDTWISFRSGGEPVA
jgi:predicted acetyltransferase